ncbi:DNA-directed RNA polymerase I subunit RPA1 [Anastrepha ludens]|uniref:DNA-directed RNA polymerase I subunit RPA1 n=1 Tax=Anastrepha ludens TaxID=28586 RepID=UPI0023B09D42|nr:DNA-directed RNA polymerase I subunit RPA1 [Anastrepha ludens]XP_053969845.1 DNA-directed RNA polymerase I subunit RPA1 [Anastrepha ludens]XP_053969846.1 DNA-directed RNA polymerase I subunit RPA1 [Anastrepha ludens]
MRKGNALEIDMLPADLEFGVFSSEEIKRLSVVKIITGLTFDPLGHPLPGGLYDSLMGTYGRRMEPCATCYNIQECPGHMGHIELNTLVFNPFFIKLVQKILSIFCLNCFKIQLKVHVCEVLALQLRLLDAGYIVEAQELEIFKSEVVCQNDENLVKLESGEYVHPRIAAMFELLKKGHSNVSNNTKTSCGIRSAIVHAAFQRVAFKKCIHCQKPLRNIRYLYRKLIYYITAEEMRNSMPEARQSTGQNKSIFADECRKFLRQIYLNYPDLLKLLCPILKLNNSGNSCPVDIFFMDTIAVVPPKARPPNILHDQILEHPQTAIYRSIIENNAVLRVVIKHLKGLREELPEEAQRVYESTKGESPYEKLYNAWQTLQTSVDLLLDITASRDSPSSQGLKQVLEKKEGLIRKHMMGKRVNYAARTVITPDPNINVEEVGIPDIFARKLSYPVPVTPWNVAELRKMVMNGPDIHPGANYIQDEKGYTTLIPADNAAKRESMAKLLFNYPENGIKVVHRHVLNGDVLLLNRQPSLHRPSIMAHKARILPGEKTFRLHYSNCKAYNADFDGDEMNAHLPQSEVARAEAYNLVNVANNYLVPKDGTPLGGLIQDHVISGVKLSIRGRFFNREDYQQLVYQGLSDLRDKIKLLPPTILKPTMLWSGKQVLSTIIINLTPEGYSRINLHTQAKINSKHWIVSMAHEAACGALGGGELCESNVIIHKGELLTGVLDKQQYGATTYGLIHCMYELYGGQVSTRLLTAFTKVFTTFLQREGFTLGVQDILVTADADAQRRKIVKECRKIGDSAVAAALDLDEIPSLDVLVGKMEEAYTKDPKFRVILDRKYKYLLDRYTNDINRTCLPDGLISQFPQNNLQLMVLSGAKGSMVNTMQISCLLGQIELEGKRPPLMISGKSLPSFTAFETSPKSGGFIDGRFMTGIQPQDFFFHCMAGREGLIDTAVKTSRSGYLQRCLIKHLEGLTVGYDMTVRDSDSSVVQYLYGEDGLDILKSKFFNTKFCMQFLALNSTAIIHPNELRSIKDEQTLLRISRHVKKLRKWQNKHNGKLDSLETKRIPSAFANFSANSQAKGNLDELNPKTGRSMGDEYKQKLWRKADAETKEFYKKLSARCPDPTTSVYKQDNCYGSTSERLEKLVEDYMKKYPNSKAAIDDIIYIKNLKALASPGEPVGLLAAQSIGEPSTQMTLNTFHFAGRGEMNVTLGIPRLREILMLASANIKTPSMDIPIKMNQSKNADKLRIKLNRVTLADILQFVKVKTKLVLKPERAHQYILRFQFLPREAYQDDFCVRPKKVLKYMSEVFFKVLFRAAIRSSKSKKSIIEINEDKVGSNKESNDKDLDEDESRNEVSDHFKKDKSTNGGEVDSSDDENANDDDDATGRKFKSRKQDETEYDDPEELEEIKDADDDDEIGVGENEDEEDTGKSDTTDALVETVLNNELVQEYTYDKEKHQWCKLTFNLNMKYKKPDISSIIRELASKCVVHQVQNIKRAIIYKGDNDVNLLKTDGINIIEVFKYNDVLDLNRLYSNDIHAIAKTYGIEAAAQVIIKEVTNVFKVYGITVDRRHLSLIADYMTFNGTFQPLSRKGMEHSSSPLQQMSFESCLQFLKNAAGSGRIDDLSSPSGRLIVGLPVRNGTGAFELLTKIC